MFNNPSFLKLDAPPVACLLTEDQQIARRADLMAALSGRRPVVTHSNTTLVWTFDTPEVRADLEEFAALERICCPTLSFDIDTPSDGVRLTVTGEPGTGPALRAWLEESPAQPTHDGPSLWMWGSITSVAGGAFALLCCVLPIGATVVALDGIGAGLLTTGAVLGGIGLWQKLSPADACGDGC